MLDHEEKFLFKEEILHLANAVGEPGVLDNVEDLLTDVITSPRFDSEVFTLERSLQVMLGPRAGTTLVGLLTVAPEVFDEVAEVRIPSEVHERLVAWRARFGLAIDNALNFLNNPDGIQGHDFSTQVAHADERRILQGHTGSASVVEDLLPQHVVADRRHQACRHVEPREVLRDVARRAAERQPHPPVIDGTGLEAAPDKPLHIAAGRADQHDRRPTGYLGHLAPR